MTVRYDFRGKIALVTGASSGAARAFAEAGAAVVLSSHDGNALYSRPARRAGSVKENTDHAKDP